MAYLTPESRLAPWASLLSPPSFSLDTKPLLAAVSFSQRAATWDLPKFTVELYRSLIESATSILTIFAFLFAWRRLFRSFFGEATRTTVRLLANKVYSLIGLASRATFLLIL